MLWSTSLTSMNNDAGINRDTTIGMNSSSKVFTAKTNLWVDILASNTTKNSLVTTKIVTTPNTKPRIKFNSAASTLTSSDGGGSCGNSTGDAPDEIKEPVELDA